ncbi:MAG: LLM class flavin-dependent oxidoreductase [bacterium]|nr:LLM class flavin-dependent oxidoreductase [bacterium]
MSAQPPIQFGISLDPTATKINDLFRLAKVADEAGFELLTIQDHAYNPNFLETWTLLSGLAMTTENIRVGTNVLTTPLRLPAMIAKQAATLHVMTNGRVELGLGAGAFQGGIEAFGGEFGTPGERHQAFEETIKIIKGLWQSQGQPFSFEGKAHQIRNAQFGPVLDSYPRLWTGSQGPRGLRLTGRETDGVILSMTYVPPDDLHEVNRLLDEGAAEAGRDPSEVRRAYNLAGALTEARMIPKRQGLIIGGVQEWVDWLVRLYRDYRQDTFIFWPVGGSEATQFQQFASEVIPAVREALGQSAATK